MLLKLLDDALQDIAGKTAHGLAEILLGKKDINEFHIAKKMHLTINQTRNLLYKLLEAGIVSFSRKKDKRKAWYTYFWTLNALKSLEVLASLMRKNIDNNKKQLILRETRRFYLCNNCSIEVNEETALQNDFTCIECGNVYELNENNKILHEIQNNIQRIEKNIAIVYGEISKLQKHEELKKSKEKSRTGPKKKKRKKSRSTSQGASRKHATKK